MVGRVVDGGDGRHLGKNRRLDTLFESHVRHAAALTAAFQAEMDHMILDRDQSDVTTVGGDRRIDLFVEQRLDRRSLGVVFSEL